MRFAIAAVLSFALTAHAATDPLELEAAAQAHAQDPNATPSGSILKGEGKKTDFQVSLDANKCYWFSAVSDGSKLAMYLWAPNAGTFTPRLTDAKTPGHGTLAHCAKETGIYRFQVKSDAGRYVVAVFAKEVAGLVPTPFDIGAVCDKTGTAGGAKRMGDFFDGHSDKNDFSVQMDAGKCYSLVACSDPTKVKAIYLYLWDGASKRVTESKTDSSNPMVGYCAKDTGMFKVQVKVSTGSGDTKLGVYTK